MECYSLGSSSLSGAPVRSWNVIGLDDQGIGDAAGQGAVAAQRLADDHALGGDLVFAHVDAVLAAAHLHHHQHLAELAVDRDVAQAHDVVGEERDGEVAQVHRGEVLLDLDGADDGHAQARERRDHPVQRLAEVGAEAGGQRHLEADQRVDHQPLAADLS